MMNGDMFSKNKGNYLKDKIPLPVYKTSQEEFDEAVRSVTPEQIRRYLLFRKFQTVVNWITFPFLILIMVVIGAVSMFFIGAFAIAAQYRENCYINRKNEGWWWKVWDYL